MTIRTCIPKDKFDLKAVKRAEAMGYPAINPILPELLEWLQDMNWPVAQALTPLLAKAGPEISPAIQNVFAQKDGWWSYCVLSVLAPIVRPEVWAMLEADIIRMAQHPTLEEQAEELDQAALGAIASHRS